MNYSILGSFEVSVDGQVLELGPPKQRALLAVLLLHANQTVATERLVELVWDDGPPRTAAHSVQIYVSELRKRFEAARVQQVISTRMPGYVLHAALQLWRGAPLADFAYHEFAQPDIRRLDELRCRAVEGLAELNLRQG